LATEDNVHEEAVKRQKAQQTAARPVAKTRKATLHPAAKTGKGMQQKKKRASSPVDEPDEDMETGYGKSSSSNSDSEDNGPVIVESVDEETNLQEETDEEELGKP
jgi:hypothetical protein